MVVPLSFGGANRTFYGVGMTRRLAWASSTLATLVGLAIGAALTRDSVDLLLFPSPILPLAIWSLAPAVAPFAVRARTRGSQRAPGLIAVAMCIEATSIVSLGGGFLFALFVAPILLLAFMTASAITSA